MKKFAVVLAAASLMVLSSCSATTITEQAGNYVYSQNEDINILDIDTRNNVGTLKITGTEILKNDSFTVKEKRGTDESGNDIYQDVTYEQLIQIFYSYDNKGRVKSLSSSNFSVSDKAGYAGEFSPNIEYSAIKRNGEDYFVAALKNRGDFVNLTFKYNSLQIADTAKIRLDISEKPKAASKNSVISSRAGQNTPENSTISSGAGQNTPENKSSFMLLYAIIGILGAAVILLLVVIIVQSKQRKQM